MENILRTFVAIKIRPEPQLMDVFEKIKNILKNDNIRWVDLGNLHLTLRFIGETFENQLEALGRLLNEIVKNHDSFHVQINGLGYFKHKGQPRVFYAKIEHSEKLVKLATRLDESVSSMGFYKEDRKFSPHLTLARIRHIHDRQNFYAVRENYGKDVFQDIMVSEIILYQSVLKPHGAEYKELKIVELN